MDFETSMRWVTESAVAMQKDRPDIYPNIADAINALSNALRYLKQIEGGAFVSFASYVLVKFYDDGVDEFILARKWSGLCNFEPEGEAYTVAHHADINLPPLDTDLLS